MDSLCALGHWGRAVSYLYSVRTRMYTVVITARTVDARAGTFLNNTLQPADSSTWSNWQQLPTFEQLQLLNQADQTMADSQPQLQRANSAPELVKLTQADSAAWQQAHAASTAGGANPPSSSALLSHRDYWVI